LTLERLYDCSAYGSSSASDGKYSHVVIFCWKANNVEPILLGIHSLIFFQCTQ
jgi:hypothetical protein